MIHPLDNRLRWDPWRGEFKEYGGDALRHDLLAGLTVAVFAVPQVMAYAILAGVPPVYGLYTAIIMSILAALFCHSGLLNTGPTNSVALLTATAVASLARPEDIAPVVFTLALLVGLIRLAMGMLKMGALVRFVSEPALLGFTVGAGLLIALGQLHHLLGVDVPADRWFIRRIAGVLRHADDSHIPSILVGATAFGLMIVLSRRARRWPAALISVVGATLLAFALGADSGVVVIGSIAPLERSFPLPALPAIRLDVAADLLPLALAIAIIGLIETASVGQHLALKSGRHVNFNQDFLGQGISQIVAAFFLCFPGSGSFVRSTLMHQCGARTRVASGAFGVFTLLLLMLVPGALNRIPIAALAGLLLYIGLRLVDLPRIKRVWATSRSDSFVMVLTFAVTVFGRMEYGIFAGIIASMVIFLNRACELHLTEIVPRPDLGFEERDYVPMSRHPESEVVAVGLSGDLFFGVAHDLRSQLGEIFRLQNPRYLIIRVRHAFSLDYSCWSAIFDFAKAFHERGGKLYVCGVRPDFAPLIHRAQMQDILPENQVFAQGDSVFRMFEQVIARIGSSLPEDARLSDEWKSYFHRLAEKHPAASSSEHDGGKHVV